MVFLDGVVSGYFCILIELDVWLFVCGVLFDWM